MKIIEDRFENIVINEELSIALGAFDGVHRGHQVLINSAVAEAKKRGIKSAVFTFIKHPLAVLKPEIKIDILTDNDTKASIIENLGIDYLFFVEFNQDFADMDPVDFLKLLKDRLNAKVLVCGYNYTFGKLGKGDRELLEHYSNEFEYALRVIEKVSYMGKNISSSIIRDKIKSGNIEEANELLGYSYFFSGKVTRGKQLGRELGFATANIDIPDNLCIKNGIYITITHVEGKVYPSVTNIGYSPTFELTKRSIETHILDQKFQLYDTNIKVEFLKFIRSEMKFNSLSDLQAQVFKDMKKAKDYFCNDDVYNL
jgi:riboflavin kinase / FMN adenylyltransferase